MQSSGSRNESFTLYLEGDTLSFQKRFYSSATNYERLYIDRYDLKLIMLSDSDMIVKPCSEKSQNFYCTDAEIKFKRQEFARDRTIHFEKIIFHTSSCFGDCPEIDLEIDSSKNIYLRGSYYEGYGATSREDRSGMFEGTLQDSLYTELILLLQTCNLRTLTFPQVIGFDGSVVTLIIYFDGQRKYFKSMFPPTIASRLIDYLYSVHDRQLLPWAARLRKLEE